MRTSSFSPEQRVKQPVNLAGLMHVASNFTNETVDELQRSIRQFRGAMTSVPVGRRDR